MNQNLKQLHLANLPFAHFLNLERREIALLFPQAIVAKFCRNLLSCFCVCWQKTAAIFSKNWEHREKALVFSYSPNAIEAQRLGAMRPRKQWLSIFYRECRENGKMDDPTILPFVARHLCPQQKWQQRFVRLIC